MAADARARILAHVGGGGVIQCAAGFAAQVVRSVARASRRRPALLGDAENEVPRIDRPTFDEVVSGRDRSRGLLRGAIQKRIVAAIKAGACCASLAADLGKSVREVRKLVRKLSRVLTRRGILQNPRRETPHRDSLPVAAR